MNESYTDESFMSNGRIYADELMNKDLEEWMKETKQTLKISHDHSIKNNKKPKGKCSICNDKQAKFICLKCGQFVCSSCYYNIIGICKKCIPKEITEKWDGKHLNWKKEKDVEWIF